MAYTPFTWKDGSAGSTPISAARLNAIEQGISAAHTLIAAANPNGLVAAAVTGIATPEMFQSNATLASDGTVYDWAPAITAAFAAGYVNIELANKYYFIRTPIRIPSNCGPRIFARGAKKAGYLNVVMNNPDRAAIEYIGVRSGGSSYNYAGITMENVCLLGNDSNCHAVWLQDVSYPNFARVNIAGFRGAGLLLDNCEDGAFDIEVQACGRTTGSYTSLSDRGNNSKTTYSGIHMISTAGGGAHNNMLRFTGEIEQMNTSPYVYINDPGAINIWFNDVHSETRDPADFYNFDFFKCDGGADVEFKGMYNAIEFRNGYLLSGYGSYRFIGGRYLNNIVQTDNGTTGQLRITGSSLGNLATVAWGGAHLISGCNVKNVTIDYPAAGPFRISDCQIAGNVSITNTGSNDSGVIIDGCRISGTALAQSNTANCEIRNSIVLGDFSWQSTNGSVTNNRLGGAVSVVPYNATFRPQIREYWLSAPPQYGNNVVGDRTWNSSPSSGGPIGWVCTSSGAPGTWKAFGTIS